MTNSYPNEFEKAKAFLIGGDRPFEAALSGYPVVTVWESPSFSNWVSFDVVLAQPRALCRVSVWEYEKDIERASTFGMTPASLPSLRLLRLAWQDLPEAALPAITELLRKSNELPKLEPNFGIDGVPYGVLIGAVGAPPAYSVQLWGGGWRDTVNPPAYLASQPDRTATLRLFEPCFTLWTLLREYFKLSDA